MSGYALADFMAYWEAEGQAYARSGDYEWMASLVPGQRVLEIGCGLGFGTQALVGRGLAVLSVDALPACLAATQTRLGEATTARFVTAEIGALSDEHLAQFAAFAPDSVVCWLLGAPAEVTGATVGDGGRAVVAYREKIHRAVAELAAALPSVQALHFVDRTAIPWQAKDIGRTTLVGYHLGKTLHDLPFTADVHHALYRKLNEGAAGMRQAKNTHPALKGAVPTLASLLAERK